MEYIHWLGFIVYFILQETASLIGPVRTRRGGDPPMPGVLIIMKNLPFVLNNTPSNCLEDVLVIPSLLLIVKSSGTVVIAVGCLQERFHYSLIFTNPEFRFMGKLWITIKICISKMIPLIGRINSARGSSQWCWQAFILLLICLDRFVSSPSENI